jgi:DNA-binding NtrC family response regulator
MGFLEKVKEYCPESEVIIITGYATIETARESFVRGAYDFIAKPFRINEIRDAVKKARRRVRKNHR